MVLLMTAALTKKMTDSKAMNNFIKLHLAIFGHLSSLMQFCEQCNQGFNLKYFY